MQPEKRSLNPDREVLDWDGTAVTRMAGIFEVPHSCLARFFG
jgi:hypothetical protein